MNHSSAWTQRPIWCLLSWLMLPALIQNGAGFVVVFGSSTTRRPPTLASAASVVPRTDSDEEVVDDDRSRIQVESEIMLPFASDVAFDAFVDLRRQPSFSKWLKSVDYIDGSTTNRVGSRSKWTVSFSGLRFSWQAESKQLDRYRGIIEWGSVTGMRNEGMSVLGGGAKASSKLSVSLNPPNYDARSFQARFSFERVRMVFRRTCACPCASTSPNLLPALWEPVAAKR
jgi:uncharacterized membrane protein